MPKSCTSSSTADSVCSCSFPAFCDCIGASCLICCFCSPEFSSGHPLSFCHQLLSSCLICLRAPSLICQEPLFSSTGPLLFNLPRDSLLQLWTFSRASFVSLPSAFLQLLKPSQGLFSNLPGASTQQLRATSVSSAKRPSSAAPDLRPLMINLFVKLCFWFGCRANRG